MAEPRHTPGPWRWTAYDHGTEDMAKLVNDAGAVVCDFGNDAQYYPTQGVPPDPADANLIAAAPDLLQYAKLEAEYTRLCDRRRPDYYGGELMEWVEAKGIGNEPVGAWLGRLRDAAIAKAEGGAT